MIGKELTDKILRNPSAGVGAKKGDATAAVAAAAAERMMKQVFTLGELSQIYPSKLDKKLFLLMQSVVFQKVRLSEILSEETI